jgi:hypothetical protein
MIRCVATAALLGLLLPACTLSNRLFEEDQLFIEAVPRQEDLRTEHPASRNNNGGLLDDEGSRDVGDPADIPPLAREVATNINALVFILLGVIDRVMEYPISAREIDRRTWGPYAYWGTDGSSRLVVLRDPDDPAFFEYSIGLTSVSTAEVTEETAWDEVLAGQFARGTASLREGTGSFCWDADLQAGHDPDFAWGGLMCAEHARNGEQIQLLVTFDEWLQTDGSRTDIEYFFEGSDDLGGVLEYVAEHNWVGGPGSALETSATRVRWLLGHAGRADMLLSGPDLPGAGVPATECWGADLERVFYFVDMPGAEPDVLEGDEGDCPFPDREDVLEIG